MKISVDAGALCPKEEARFGNYTFTRSLIEIIQNQNKMDEYFIYSFCPKPSWLKESRTIHYQRLKPKVLWLSTRVSIEELRRKKDIFLALNQAIPISTTSRVIAFSHGLSFYFYPQYYPDSYHALKDELDTMVERSEAIVVASIRVKKELKKIYPKRENIKIINFGVPHDMLDHQSSIRKKYFLFVGMNNRIKNIDFIIGAFKKFRSKRKIADFKLVLVGDLKSYEDQKSGITAYVDISRPALKKLYSQASAYLTASFYESFNFPVLEALAQNCPVVGLKSAIIPEFTPYVNVANNLDEFVNFMEVVSRKNNRNMYRREILSRFSWNKYFIKLSSLFSKI